MPLFILYISPVMRQNIFLGKELTPHKHWSSFLPMTSWLFGGAMLCYIYSSLLIGGLTFPSREKVPRTWDQLLDSNWTIGFAKSTLFEDILLVSQMKKTFVLSF